MGGDARLTSESPLPIALDEELIGCNTLVEKRKLLSAIQTAVYHPQTFVAWWNKWWKRMVAEAERRVSVGGTSALSLISV